MGVSAGNTRTCPTRELINHNVDLIMHQMQSSTYCRGVTPGVPLVPRGRTWTNGVIKFLISAGRGAEWRLELTSSVEVPPLQKVWLPNVVTVAKSVKRYRGPYN